MRPSIWFTAGRCEMSIRLENALSLLFNRKFFLDGICFAIAKGTAFLAPILAIRIIPLADYGMLETSYAWGQQLTMLAVLGIPAAYPYFILKRRETEMQAYFWLYGVFLCLCVLFSALLHRFRYLPEQLFLVILLTAAFSMERILSGILKTHGLGRIGVLIDSGYYFILGTVLVILAFVHRYPFFPLLILLLLCFILFLGGWFLLMARKRCTRIYSSDIQPAVKKLLVYSIPLIFSGLIIYWLIASSRIYLSWLLGDEVVAIYAFCFRWFAIAILIYQFAYIMFFKKLYIVRPENLDRNFCILTAIVFGSTAFCLAGFFVISPFFEMVRYEHLLRILLLLGCLMPVWCATALNEGIIARENLVMQMNLALLPQLLLFPLLLFLLRKTITLDLFCLLHLMSCILVYFTQAFILVKRGIRFGRTAAIIAVICCSSWIFYFLF